MFYIVNNDTSIVVLTLNEKVLTSEPIFLFELTNQLISKKIYFTAPDISLFPERYNEFVIEIEDLDLGAWDYKVYEVEEELEELVEEYETDGLNVLEIGKCVILSTEDSEEIIYQQSVQNNVVYNG